MRLIEIQDGISINTDKIHGIEKVDDNSCKIYAGDSVYLSTIPYETVIKLLQNEKVVDKAYSQGEKMVRTFEKLDKVLNTSQFTAL